MGDTTVLLVGCYQQTEFASAVRHLSRVANLLFAANSQEALAKSREMPIPGVVVLVQSRPGQLSHQGVLRLQQTWPLSQFVALLGSWCEGEVRTGKPWPNIPRVYAHQWPGRLRYDCQGPALFDLANRIEEEVSTSPPVPTLGIGRLVAIYASNDSYGEALGDVLADAGYPVVCLSLLERPYVAGVETVLYETNREWEQAFEDLDELRRRHPGAKLVAIETFPRAEEIDELKQRGVSAIVSQPFRLEDLIHQLGSLGSKVTSRVKGQPAA